MLTQEQSRPPPAKPAPPTETSASTRVSPGLKGRENNPGLKGRENNPGLKGRENKAQGKERSPG